MEITNLKSSIKDAFLRILDGDDKTVSGNLTIDGSLYTDELVVGDKNWMDIERSTVTSETLADMIDLGEIPLDFLFVAPHRFSFRVGKDGTNINLFYYPSDRYHPTNLYTVYINREPTEQEYTSLTFKAGDIIDEQKEELHSLRREFAVMKREKRDLEKELEESVKLQKRLEADNWRLDHEMSVKERIEYFRQRGTDAETLSLLRWLKSGVPEYGRTYDFDQIQVLLIALLDAECPGMSGRIQGCTTNLTKRTICYLIALGLDDEAMHFRATPNVSDKTVRNYRKECRELVDSW